MKAKYKILVQIDIENLEKNSLFLFCSFLSGVDYAQGALLFFFLLSPI
jgi:hypothetical protein